MSLHKYLKKKLNIKIVKINFISIWPVVVLIIYS